MSYLQPGHRYKKDFPRKIKHMTKRSKYSVCLQFKSNLFLVKKKCTRFVLLLFPVAWTSSGKLKVDTEMQLWEAGLGCLESRDCAVEFLYCASLPPW